MRILSLLFITSLLISQSFGQQSKFDELLKQINFKLRVQSTGEGKTFVEADNEGNIIITRTIQLSTTPNFHLSKSFNIFEVNMMVELMPTEIQSNSKTYILYFRCKDEKCIRFENDNGLARSDNTGELFFGKKENADKMESLFLQLKKSFKRLMLSLKSAGE